MVYTILTINVQNSASPNMIYMIYTTIYAVWRNSLLEFLSPPIISMADSLTAQYIAVNIMATKILHAKIDIYPVVVSSVFMELYNIILYTSVNSP